MVQRETARPAPTERVRAARGPALDAAREELPRMVRSTLRTGWGHPEVMSLLVVRLAETLALTKGAAAAERVADEVADALLDRLGRRPGRHGATA